MIRAARRRPVVAAVLVSLITLGVVGGVILATTSVGCGPANKLGLKGISSRCEPSLPASARVPTSSPTPQGASASPSASPVSSIPASGPASSYLPPFSPPAQSGVPGLAINCRLPVYVGPSGSGGFITFPEGKFVADPLSAVTIPAPAPGASPPPSTYSGPFTATGLSYDGINSRWLPAPSVFRAPDGSRYAYVSSDLKSVNVVDAATGATTKVGQGGAWAIIGVDNEGLYAHRASTQMFVGDPPGLWLLPYSGAAKQIIETGYWQIAASGAAYGEAARSEPAGAPDNTIIRLDLKSGAVSNWFTRGLGWSEVLGIDAQGNALITVTYPYSVDPSGIGELWSTTGPDAAVPISSTVQGLSLAGRLIADSHGIWLPMWNHQAPGVALYVAGEGLYWMANTLRGQEGWATQLAGGCA